MVLPPPSQILAARRWLELWHSGEPRARALLLNSAVYADVSASQYEAALEWIRRVGLVTAGTVRLAKPAASPAEAILLKSVDEAKPTWFVNFDQLIAQPDDLPIDVISLCEILDLPPERAFALLTANWRLVDSDNRARIGALGETLLIEALRAHEISAVKASDVSDMFGYDIIARRDNFEVHIEVKTTTQSRNVVYLSRNECVSMVSDPLWCFVLVRMDRHNIPQFATVQNDRIQASLPTDNPTNHGRWQSFEFGFQAEDLSAGIDGVLARLQSRS